MNIKELMLDNWVLVGENTKLPMQVVGVFKDVVHLAFEGTKSTVWEEKESDIFPIPLTEELLVKNGFALNDCGYVKEYSNKDKCGYFVHVYFLDGTCIQARVSALNQIILIEGYYIKYLHQLQNLLMSAGVEIQFKV